MIDPTAWRLAKVLADPEQLFVLWLIHQGICSTPSEFVENYGTGILSAIKSLTLEEFITEQGDRLILQPYAKRALMHFSEEDGFAGTQTDLAKLEDLRSNLESAREDSRIATRPTVLHVPLGVERSDHLSIYTASWRIFRRTIPRLKNPPNRLVAAVLVPLLLVSCYEIYLNIRTTFIIPRQIEVVHRGSALAFPRLDTKDNAPFTDHDSAVYIMAVKFLETKRGVAP